MLATRFLTSVIEGRKPIFDYDGLDFIQIIENTIQYELAEETIQLHAYCIMPNHVHILYSEPFNVDKFRERFLRVSARRIIQQNNNRVLAKRIDFQVDKSDRKEQVWRRNSKLILISEKSEYYTRRQYIKSNLDSEYWKDSIPPEAKHPKLACKHRVWPS
ncbi:MAG: transposase [Bacteroidia bacterium]